MVSIVARKSGRLRAIEECQYVSKNGNARRGVKCKCECGNVKVVGRSEFLSEKVKSCGCLITEFNKTKIGNTYGSIRDGEVLKNLPHYARIRSIWKNMKSRCNNPKATSYEIYGGRGITVCNEWKREFKSFYDWAVKNGYADDLTIDRIDVNGNYEPSNCRWATASEQNRNTRVNNNITINGVTHCLTDWADILGINQDKLRKIIKNI